MNLPNKITICRIVLIPVFVSFAIWYSQTVGAGQEEIWLRFTALAVFALASLSDALDGYIARHYAKSTSLGKALDPVADKLLLLAAILTLSFTNWRPGLPVWFGGLVVGRDLLIIFGYFVIRYFKGRVKMKAYLSSKICTTFQMITVCWALLDVWSGNVRPFPLIILIYLAAFFTVFSGLQYIWNGICQLRNQNDNTASQPDSQDVQ